MKLWIVCAATISPIAAKASAQDSAALMERLHRAAALSSIDDSQLKPWHLKLSFQLFDSRGNPTETGTIEEWWADPTLHKTLYTSPSYTATEIRSKDGYYRTKGTSSVPSLLELVLQQVVHPMPSEQEIAESKPDLRKENAGKAPLDCIMLGQEIKNVAFPPLGLFPTYCLDRDQDSLRANYDYGSQLIVRNKIGSFQHRNVVIDQATLQGKVTEISAHLDVLEAGLSTEIKLVPSADVQEVNPSPVMVAAGVIQGSKITSVPPVYPESARRNNVSGSVILRARIGTDGHIHSLKVISTPDAELAVSSLIAVRQWTYKPYLLNGAPVEVNTQITVNFAIGR